MGTLSSFVSVPLISSVASSNVTYRLSAGQSRPSASVYFSTMASGSIVTFQPGM